MLKIPLKPQEEATDKIVQYPGQVFKKNKPHLVTFATLVTHYIKRKTLSKQPSPEIGLSKYYYIGDSPYKIVQKKRHWKSAL